MTYFILHQCLIFRLFVSNFTNWDWRNNVESSVVITPKFILHKTVIHMARSLKWQGLRLLPTSIGTFGKSSYVRYLKKTTKKTTYHCYANKYHKTILNRFCFGRPAPAQVLKRKTDGNFLTVNYSAFTLPQTIKQTGLYHASEAFSIFSLVPKQIHFEVRQQKISRRLSRDWTAQEMYQEMLCDLQLCQTDRSESSGTDQGKMERHCSIETKFPTGPKRSIYVSTEISFTSQWSGTGPTGPTGERGPPLEVHYFFRKISTWTESFHLCFDRNFRNFLLLLFFTLWKAPLKSVLKTTMT